MKKKLFLLVFILLWQSNIFAQWIPKAIGLLPTNYGVTSLEPIDESTIWASANNYSIWLDGSTIPSDHKIYVLRSTDGGENWTMLSIPNSDGYISVDILAIDAQTVYVASMSYTDGFALFYTLDGGLNWLIKYGVDMANSLGIYLEAFNADDWLSFAWGGIASTSDDGGISWNSSLVPPFLSSEYFILFSPSNQSALKKSYAWFPTSKGRIFKTMDKGLNWTVLNTPWFNNQCIQTLAFSDTLTGIMASHFTTSFSLTTQKLMNTQDGGLNWNTLADAPRRIQAITEIPGTSGVYMAVSDTSSYNKGSLLSNDNGNSWLILDTNNYYSAVKFYDNSHGWAGLGTLADSTKPAIYKWGGIPLGISSYEKEKVIVNLFPNPSADRIIELKYSLRKDSKLMVKVMDMTGKEMLSAGINAKSGENTYSLTCKQFPQGIYLVNLSADDFSITRKLILY